MLPLDYPTILRQRIKAGEITWQMAYDWLILHGMRPEVAKVLLW